MVSTDKKADSGRLLVRCSTPVLFGSPNPPPNAFEHTADALRTLETRAAVGKIALSLRPNNTEGPS
ncbi:hypothetical protein [Rhodococcus tibetensis]|uniref:Uncharacterized protein n=1 Tax=Rhodococcus tibetensis TaxID=2965064 RepID=A0ABT1QH41_9NOCA|nr:hypothetical protein [Rhodococcus sp. FXJ9.536]MCQ4121599.1 hypothetical protein [Rhodococcus sp. FXJ9.536]